MRHRLSIALLGMIALLLPQAYIAGAHAAALAPAADWAQPLQVNGVPNLHEVSARLYRSAQPNAEGFMNIKRMGIKTVVNLRSFHTDRDELGTTDLASEHIYMKAWHPEKEDMVRFLKIVADPRRTPVLVHCQHGADRTGTICAIYRIAVQGWTKEAAIQEMVEGGFGFHKVWINLVPWIKSLDIDALRREAGLQGLPKKAINQATDEELLNGAFIRAMIDFPDLACIHS